MDKAKARKWMRRNVEHHLDLKTGECNVTALAEECAATFNADYVLDDETHWIWDEAIEAAEHEERHR